MEKFMGDSLREMTAAENGQPDISAGTQEAPGIAPLAVPAGVPGQWRTGATCDVSFGNAKLLFGDGILYKVGSGYVCAYDPATDSWKTSVQSGYNNMLNFGCAYAAGKVYCLGGRSGNNVHVTALAYDTASGTWERLADAPVGFTYADCFVWGNKIVCLNISNTYFGSTPHNNPLIYDIESNTWVYTSMPTPRTMCACVQVENKVYCMGGQTDTNVFSNKVEIYDLARNSWTTGPNLPQAVSYVTGMYHKGQVVCCGGQTRSGTSNYNNAMMYRLDLEKNEWLTHYGYHILSTTWTHSACAVGDRYYFYQAGTLYIGSYYTNYWGTFTGQTKSAIATISMIENDGVIYGVNNTNGVCIYTVGEVELTIQHHNEHGHNGGYTKEYIGLGESYSFACNTSTYSHCIGYRIFDRPLVNALQLRLDNIMEDTTVTFVYRGNQEYTITERYLNTVNNQQLQPATQTVVRAYEEYVKRAPCLEGYRRTGYKINNNTLQTVPWVYYSQVSANTTVDFYYNPAAQEAPPDYDVVITEQYYDQSGGRYLLPDTQSHYAYGDHYMFQAPRLEDYKRVGVRIDGNAAEAVRTAALRNVQGDHTVTFLYESCLGDGCIEAMECALYEMQKDKNAENLLSVPQAYRHQPIRAGGDYACTASMLDGYVRVGHRIAGGALQASNTAQIKAVYHQHQINFRYAEEGEDFTDPGDIPITERFYDEVSGTYLQPDLKQNVVRGEDYVRTAPAISGYDRMGYRIGDGQRQTGVTATIRSVEEADTVTFLYQPAVPAPNEYTVTERYQLANGTQVLPPTTQTLTEGDTYQRTAPEAEGYIRVGHRVDGADSSPSRSAVIEDIAADHVVIFLYEEAAGEPEPEEFIITERYYNVDSGLTIQTATSTLVEEGGSYGMLAPRVEGYKRVGHRIDGGEASDARTAVIIDVQADHIVTFLYQPCDGESCVEPEELNITERYYDVENQTYISPDTYTPVLEGESYVRTAPAKAGYRRVGHTVDGGDTSASRTAIIEEVGEAHTVTFLYEPCDGESCVEVREYLITQRYYDRQNNRYIRSNTYVMVGAGGIYSRTAPTASGYVRAGHRIDNGAASSSLTATIVNVQHSRTVTFLYDPQGGGTVDPGDVVITERYYDVQAAGYIRANTTTRVAVGGDYLKSAPTLTGYRRVGHQVDSEAASGSLTASLTNVRTAHTVTFRYEKGTDISGGDEVMITERYVNENTQAEIRSNSYRFVTRGGSYSRTAPALSGYTATGHQVDGAGKQTSTTAGISNVQSARTVTFYYKPEGTVTPPGDDLLITERYYDRENGAYIQSDTHTAVSPGAGYQKTAPAVTGYKRVGYRLDGGAEQTALTVALTDVQTAHTVVFLYEPDTTPPADKLLIVEQYYDEQNDEFIQPDTTASVRPGGTYAKTAPDIDGYVRTGHRIDGADKQAAITVRIGEVLDPHVVTFLYKPDDGTQPPEEMVTVTERYYDVENARFIQSDTRTRLPKGADYGKTAPELADYVRLGHQMDGEAAQGSFTAVLGDVQADHTVTFLYKPQEGEEVEPPESTSLLITERYYDTVGRTFIQADTYTRVTRGREYRKTAPAIADYFRLGHRVDGGADRSALTAVIEEVQSAHVVTFLYEPTDNCDEFVIQERYYDVANERFVRPDTETLVSPGGDYGKTAPELMGYIRVGHRVDNGADQAALTAELVNVRADHVITFLYRPEVEETEEFVIRERYYDVENGTYVRADTQTRVAAGESYQKTAPDLIAYVRVGHRVDNGAESAQLTAQIAEVQADHQVTFLYRPEESECDGYVVRERYYDVQGQTYIRPDTETLVEAGQDYGKSAPAIGGYTAIGHRIDGGAENAALTAVISQVASDHTVIFLYRPQDDGGNGDGNGAVTGNGCCCCCDKHLPTLDIHVPIVGCNNRLIQELARAMQAGANGCCSGKGACGEKSEETCVK